MNGRRVKDIFPVEYKKDVTRGDVNDIDCENLLYVVNFEDEKGFAFWQLMTALKMMFLQLLNKVQ